MSGMGIGVADVAKSLASLLPNTNIDDALNIIERDFCDHDGLGPVGAAHFIARGPDDDISGGCLRPGAAASPFGWKIMIPTIAQHHVANGNLVRTDAKESELICRWIKTMPSMR